MTGRFSAKLVWLMSALLLEVACSGERTTGPSIPSGDPAAFRWSLPDGFPQPLVPADNPMSDAKVELGRRLFYDTRLSGNNAVFVLLVPPPGQRVRRRAQPAVRLHGTATPAEQHVAA